MNYTELHAALIELETKLTNDGAMKTSYVAMMSAIKGKVKKLSDAEDQKMPVLNRLRKTLNTPEPT
jgi:hypothetical protein